MNSRYIAIFIASICLVGSFGLFQPANIAASKPLTVCEVLQKLSKYRGHVIEVRGEFNGGELTGDCIPLKTGNITWISKIDLEFPSDTYSTEEGGEANWKYDEDSHKVDLMDQILAMRKAAPTKRIMATIKGRLDGLKEIKMRTEGVDQRPVFLGFGHLNVYPARLVLKAVRDIEYEDHSAKPSVIPHVGPENHKVFE